MIEVFTPVLAWVGVVCLQALLHFTLGSHVKSARNGKQSVLQRSASQDKDSLMSPDQSFRSCTEGDELDAASGSLDGDEPQIFFELLSQTGSEMISSRRSLYHMVQEELEFSETDLSS